jgi:hypothetical protein
MAVRDLTDKLYNDIKRDFEKYSNIKEFGVQKYSLAWVFGKLGDKYYKSPKTIENIVFNRTQHPTSQLALFSSQAV